MENTWGAFHWFCVGILCGVIVGMGLCGGWSLAQQSSSWTVNPDGMLEYRYQNPFDQGGMRHTPEGPRYDYAPYQAPKVTPRYGQSPC